MIVKQEVKDLEKSQVELSITVEQQALQEAYDKIVAKYLKTVQLPGFRKGKVPRSVLENKIGEGMQEESVYTVIDEAVQKAIEEVEEAKKPLAYATPALKDEENISKRIDEDLTFSVVYDILPSFELPAYTEQTVDVKKVIVSDETVNAEIEKLREQDALVIEKDKKIEDGDIITVDYVELDESGEEVAGTSRKDFVFTVGSGTNFYKIDDEVISMAKGDEKIIEKSYPEDFESAEYAGKTIKLKIAVKVVKVRDVPALDDEFAQDVSEAYKTVDDLRKGTKEKLETSVESHLKEEKLNALFEHLLKDCEFSVPQTMIEAEIENSWRRFVSSSGMPEEQLIQYLQMSGQDKASFTAGWAPSAEESLRVQLVMEKIKEKENFEVSEEELNQEVETQLKDITDENMKTYYTEMIKDDLKTRKTTEFLLEKNIFNETDEVSYDDFMSHHHH